eukprot:TRINITY_DN15865_c0_g1_i1.p1 TRINITY_DN15865_c0_g1~~TRINITY_DN15865_c0_g1_i1.p1  ORF type:complete len:280 (+),score=53.09 TRINITY_DN15865_c0_g1_i1:29-868(+)
METDSWFWLFVFVFAIVIVGAFASSRRYHRARIVDSFKSIGEVQAALHKAGLEASSLIVGVDFTKSNVENGRRSFGGRCLHALGKQQNPYEQVIDMVGRTLEVFDDDKLIPCFGFGDVTTSDRAVFPFNEEERPCYRFSEVLARYRELAPHVVLSGPTSFAPLIRKAIQIVRDTQQYHILVIIADGQVTNVTETEAAIVEASEYALSIVMVGVGDGPWDTMNEFDDGLPQRKFDNFQFVNFHEVMSRPGACDAVFATNALMELPEQYTAIRKLRLLGKQ